MRTHSRVLIAMYWRFRGVDYVIVFLGVNDLGISFGNPTGPMADFFKKLRPTTPATARP